MLWRLGWFLNTLNYQVKKNLKDTIYSSEAYRLYKWSFIESQIIQWSRRPISYVFFILIALALIQAAGYFLERNIFPLETDSLLGWSWLYDWQKSLLSVQVTLVGVVLPLAISLVGILLQRKTASKAIWSLYRQYSGFLFLSFSSIAALLYIGAGPYIDTLMEPVSYSLWCALSFIWVSFNILLIGWFIRATFLIVHEPYRDQLLLRYTINESFVEGIKSRLSYFIPEESIRFKLISTSEDSKLDISTFRFSQEGEESISVKFRKPKYVSEIRFRILNVAVYLITKSIESNVKKSRLILPLKPNNHASKVHTLAAFKGFDPGFSARSLLRLSYRFSRNKPFSNDLVDEILLSLVGSAEDDLRERNPALFEQSVRRLAEWHCSVSDALSFVTDENANDNWLLLPSSSFWSRTYLDEMLRAYYLLTLKAVDAIPESVSYYEGMTHFQIKIYSWGEKPLPERAAKDLIYSSYLTWVALVRWASTTTKVPGTLIYNQYEHALLVYVGAWESWPLHLEPRSQRWKDNTKSVPLYLHHLICTGQQIISALRDGEQMASEWAADMMVNWISNISLHEYQPVKHFWIHELVTVNILDRESTCDIWQLILNENNYNEMSAAQLAVENAWVDVRLVCAAYLQASAKDNDGPYISRIVQALVDGKRLKPTGGVERGYEPIATGGDILAAYIRQRCYWEHGEESYGNWMDSIVSTFSRIEEPKRVSGRIYSSVGADDVRSLQVQYVQLSIFKSNRQWELPKRWVEVIFSTIFDQAHRDTLVRELNIWLKIAKIDITPDDEVFTENRIANFVSSIEELISLITNKSMDEIRSAPIDEHKLLELAYFASKSGFSKEPGVSAVKLFGEVIPSGVAPHSAPKTLKVSGYSKSNIAEGIEVNRAINEGEWIDDAVSKHVSMSIFQEIFSLPKAVETEFESNLELLNRLSADIRQHSNELGEMSVFVASWSVISLLDKMLFTSSDSRGLAIEYRQGLGNSYVCHFEGCAVYQISNLKNSHSLLVPNATLKSITFLEFSPGRFVDVTYENLSEETLKLTLIFKYYMEINFGDEPVYSYISLSGAEE
ncbi:hypothetical protein [Marinimicrobium sp. C2-29]|uniref:hypothetical protein n=1 Tax=Marinimicrobium sp. C2-29 TaxID=3139825 RepID=UPI003138A805